MKDRGAAILIIAGLTLAGAACGHPQQGVVDNYFRAINAGDNQTLSAFAMVDFGEKVEAWEIIESFPEDRSPATLPDLAKVVEQVEGDLEENKKTYNTYFLDNPSEVDQVRELLRSESRIPSKLQKYATDWQGFIDREKELKKALAEAKDAVAKEKKNVTLSVEPDEGVEKLIGESVTQTMDLALTVKGQTKTYTMTLRKYELSEEEGGPERLNRYVIYDLEPKS